MLKNIYNLLIQKNLKCDFHRFLGNAKWYTLITEEDLKNMENNVTLRQTGNDVNIIRSLINELKIQNNINLENKLKEEMQKLPNITHPRLLNYTLPMEIMRHWPIENFNKCREFSDICKSYNLFRMDHLANYSGHKSYYLQGPLATLEQALVRFALNELTKYDFDVISVPDILPSSVIESCGVTTNGERTLVYKIDNDECLSGTSEMALAGHFANTVFDEKELPIKVTAVSRCYRAETSGLQQEKGIYRVHQFTKVEMFSISAETQSENMLEHFKSIEVELFQKLGLNFRLLDMPPIELGAPAYQKYDIEAWMPGRKMFGEISSCSNCTDYQTSHLQIQYRTKNNELKFAHSINGTAAAIPRLLIAIVESNQDENGDITIPECLRDYIQQEKITKCKKIPELKLVKRVQT